MYACVCLSNIDTCMYVCIYIYVCIACVLYGSMYRLYLCTYMYVCMYVDATSATEAPRIFFSDIDSAAVSRSPNN